MFDLDRIKKILKKATAMNSQPTVESFPELKKVLIWMRFALGLSYGIYLGYFSRLQSPVMMLQALNLVAFLPVLYAKFYLGVKNSSEMDVVFAGLFNGLALCLLVWIYCFTLRHESEEEQLKKMIVLPAGFGETIVDSVTDKDTVLDSTTETARPEF